ncbi:MAG: TonB-dependent receptor, partial [Pseudomonadales bacterium]
SIAAFYKDLTKPIEVVTIGGGSDDRGVRSFANADNGELYGIEIDGRYSLDFLEGISPILGGLYIAGNLAWIESEVEVGESDLGVGTNPRRELQGQSPWVANATLGYSNPSRGTEMILMFNMFGDRIVEAGVNGAPDAREQARASLDFNLKQVVFNAFEVGFKVRNIFDTKFEVSQGSLLQREFKHGRAISLSVSYEL